MLKSQLTNNPYKDCFDCSSVRSVNHKPDVSFSAYVNDNIKLQKLREDLKMDVTQILMLITILVYLAAMVGIGAVLAKQNQTTDDFYLGGRTLGPLVTAMSAEASDMSSWLLMGLPGVAYLSGTADAAWTAIGLAIGTYVNWLVVAKRLRNYTHVCGNSTTLPLSFLTVTEITNVFFP